ncbi:hypothetical protein DAPPUDRAFT_331558 [Daphnia pulex]|uniref:Uncharacterized protein n=1 Tax=Daphnia pulex TaxID=6669 RepID=E9HMT2_DAPPU|nr:hypothetical protein DAPPUDRAFT_331558 [Daphnia pulex]|eukprot:EFX66918.1 hypothetical protein DAPPUDRAFT_331558 [Daphnia pulex]
MPFDEVEQLVAFEKVLMGEKHSRICMVCYLVNQFKTATLSKLSSCKYSGKLDEETIKETEFPK